MKNSRRLLRQNSVFIYSVSMLFISILLFVAIALPAFKKTLALRLNVKRIENEIELFNKKMALLNSLNTDEITNQLNSLVSAVPVEKSLSTLMQTLDYLSGKSALSISDIELASPGSISTVSAALNTQTNSNISGNKLSVSIKGKGSISQARAFLQSASSISRLLHVNQLRISYFTSGPGSASMKIDTFYKPLPQLTNTQAEKLDDFTPLELETLSKVDALVAAASYNRLVPTSFQLNRDPFSQ